jgi:hypothetical protein
VIVRLARLGMACALCLGVACPAPAQVPFAYRDLYAALDARLARFDQQLDARPAAATPVLFAAELLTANGNRGKQLLRPETRVGVDLELDRLRALGVQGVTVAIPFPLLYDPYWQEQGDAAASRGMVEFFRWVAGEVHGRGMKLLVESGVMFPGVYSAGSEIDAKAYYETLTDAQYVEGRAQNIVAIAGDLGPDLLDVGSEPDTEFRLTGKEFVRDPRAFARMVRTFVDRTAAAGFGAVPLAAGTGTWYAPGASYVAELCKIGGLAAIDLHLYPINRDYLDKAMALAQEGHACGKRVTMLETWLEKIADDELGSTDAAVDPTIFARDASNVWGPLDQRFLNVIAKYARVAGVDTLSAFWSRYFFAYLDPGLVAHAGAAQVLTWAAAAAAQAMVDGASTDTGLSYRAIIAGDATAGAPSR